MRRHDLDKETHRVNSQIAVVDAWHDALNAGDVDRLAELVHEDVEVGGPRGSGHGVVPLREWVERAGIRLEPGRRFQQGDAEVVTQRASWRSPDTGQFGDPQEVASAFWVRDGRVQRVIRYVDLSEALAAAGLDESHEVRAAAARSAGTRTEEQDGEMQQQGANDELTIGQDGPVLRITLTRPGRRNALSRSLVAALGRAFASVAEDGETRVVVLSGDGAVFCAGGDISEFVESAEHGQARADAEGITDLLTAIARCPVPVVARVHGAAFGGGVGLVCAADIVIAAEGTRFSLSEARLGLAAATIAPHVIAAIGAREAKARMLLATPFGVDEALRIELIHHAVSQDGLDAAVEEVITNLLHCAPGALAAIKRLPSIVRAADPDATRAAMTDLLVERLGSEEGQEGLTAFLEKRPAAWVPEGGKPR